VNLSPHDLQLLKDLLDRGEPLPPKYRLLLFADAPQVELIWQGKTSEVASAVLPFQSIEQIDEPRSEATPQQLGLFSVDARSGRQSGGWTIWNNKATSPIRMCARSWGLNGRLP